MEIFNVRKNSPDDITMTPSGLLQLGLGNYKFITETETCWWALTSEICESEPKVLPHQVRIHVQDIHTSKILSLLRHALQRCNFSRWKKNSDTPKILCLSKQIKTLWSFLKHTVAETHRPLITSPRLAELKTFISLGEKQEKLNLIITAVELGASLTSVKMTQTWRTLRLGEIYVRKFLFGNLFWTQHATA